MNYGQDVPASGLWSLAIINSAIFIFFAFSFFQPKTTRDWCAFGTFSAFIVALFVEMTGCRPSLWSRPCEMRPQSVLLIR